MTTAILHRGDCVKGLRGMDAATFDLVITSPPYGDLRIYGGHWFTRAVFESVAREVWRVTKSGGVVCWQEGDRLVRGSFTDDPHRHLLFFRDLGFGHYETIFSGTSGGRNMSRHYANPPQYVWVMSKGRPTTVNLLTRPNRTAGRRSGVGYRRADGTRVDMPRVVVREEGVREVWWYYPTVGHTEPPYHLHPAPMHQRLARDLILSYSRKGDRVLDPFAGVATTGKMAVLEGRSFTGWEIHLPYWEMGVERLRTARLERCRQLLSTPVL